MGVSFAHILIILNMKKTMFKEKEKGNRFKLQMMGQRFRDHSQMIRKLEILKSHYPMEICIQVGISIVKEMDMVFVKNAMAVLMKETGLIASIMERVFINIFREMSMKEIILMA